MKTKKLPVLLTALLLCAVLLLSACGPKPGGDASEPWGTVEHSRERRTIPYSDMQYERPDVEAMKTRMAELTEAMIAADSFETVKTLDTEVEDLYEHFNSMHTLAFLGSRQDETDTFFDAEYRYLNEVDPELSLLANHFNQAIVDGPYAADYEEWVGSYVYAAIVNSLLLNSEEVVPLKQERAELEADYEQMLSALAVEADGESYTLEAIESVDSASLYYQLMELFYATHGQAFVDMYNRMVQLDQEIAYKLGFDSAQVMYYFSMGRDYSPDEAQQLCDDIKEVCVPLLPLAYFTYFDAGVGSLEVTEAAIPEALAEVNSELVECWQFMLDNGLYDFEARPNKMVGHQFTTTIGEYDAPFIFSYWRDGSFNSASTIIHEFGHFYDSWLTYDLSSTSGPDVNEISSQGLEMLMHPMLERFTDNADAARLGHLQSMLLNSLVYQSLLEEFQLKIYELDTFDMTIAGRLWADLMGEYGLNASPDASGADHSWMTVPHLFTSPFYTMGYVTSAAGALQIWAQGQESWDTATATYLAFMHADHNMPLNELLESVGLKSVLDKATLEEIAGQIETVFTKAYNEYNK